ncbi:MAG: DUF4215 domain-containing protein [Deltaproteobacteria bacterium]|nr:DUF4215 domain-containing protein [Deltaproteobacteria bacterium]
MDTEGGTSPTTTDNPTTDNPTTDNPATTVSEPTAGVDTSGGDDTCGDGMITGAEACDDGGTSDGDGCSSTCAQEPGFSCEGEPSVCTSMCGDGVPTPDEECDDGNVLDEDGCDECAIEPGWACTQDSPSVCTSSCGDGMIMGAEVCDDGDAIDGNGCSAQCTVELYFRCVSEGPGSCQPIRILYGSADVDDPAHRAAIADITGGTVEHINTLDQTPSLPDLTGNYDCVFTYASNPYADGGAFGSNLANFVDFGGNVVLGVVAPLPAAGLVGSPIMEPMYSPIAPTSGVDDLAMPVSYNGDGTTVIVQDIIGFGIGQAIDETPALQGAGIADGTYSNGSIAIAYRPDFKVVYLNGAGSASLNPGGGWPRLTANACAAGFVQ